MPLLNGFEPDKKDTPPRSISDTKNLIEKTFAAQPHGGWDERERLWFCQSVGAGGYETEKDVRKVFNALRNEKMILLAS